MLSRAIVGIIGAGPSGLQASIALSRVRRDILVFDSGEYRNAPSKSVHSIFGCDGQDNKELRALSRKQIQEYGTATFVDDSVVNIEEDSSSPRSEYIITTKNGGSHRVSKIIFATGIKDIINDPSVSPTNEDSRYKITGFAKLWKMGRITHCPFCHGWENRDRKLAIFADGDAVTKTIKMAISLNSDITVYPNGPLADADGLIRARYFSESAGLAKLDERKIVSVHTANEDHDSDIVLTFEDGSTQTIGSIMYLPSTEIQPIIKSLLEKLRVFSEVMEPFPGIKIEYVRPTDMLNRTVNPDVYVAGDLSMPMRSVPTAIASAAITAAAVHEDLASELLK